MLTRRMALLLGFILLLVLNKGITPTATGCEVTESHMDASLSTFMQTSLEAADVSTMSWNKTYGGFGDDKTRTIFQTEDGAFVIAGYTDSSGMGSHDAWLLKIDAHGMLLWNQTFGGSGDDRINAVLQTMDEGFALAGITDSSGAGGQDAWLLKTDPHGMLLWNQTFGGAGDDKVNAIIETTDGGLILAGSIWSSEANEVDAWLLKIDAYGTLLWSQIFSGSGDDKVNAAIETVGGGFALVGSTSSYGTGSQDAWLLKTDDTGSVQWNQTYGGMCSDEVSAVIEMADGGFALAGWTLSYGTGLQDAWLLKTNARGTLQWSQTYGGVIDDWANAVLPMADGGFTLVGSTRSSGVGGGDAWILKTDAYGTLQWNQTYGDRDIDEFNAVIETADGGFILTGWTSSYGAGGYDAWLIKTVPADEFLSIAPRQIFGFTYEVLIILVGLVGIICTVLGLHIRYIIPTSTKRTEYFKGIVAGSGISTILLYLTFSGLFDRAFLPGLYEWSIPIPGALVAGQFAHDGRKGALAGIVTGLLSYLISMIIISPLIPTRLVLLRGTILVGVALGVGGIAGYMHEKERSEPIRGIIFGTLITAILYFMMLLILRVTILGLTTTLVYVFIALSIPGALIAGLIVRKGARGAGVGVLTGVLGFIITDLFLLIPWYGMSPSSNCMPYYMFLLFFTLFLIPPIAFVTGLSGGVTGFIHQKINRK